jgi:hypothetical protein
VPDLRSRASAPLGSTRRSPFAPPRDGRPSTKNPFEIHTRCCRVRRKRKRLTSNGSIESDAAVGPLPTLEVCLAASLPIETYVSGQLPEPTLRSLTFVISVPERRRGSLRDVLDAAEAASAKRLAPVRELLAYVRDACDFCAALVASGKVNDALALGRRFFARSIEERLSMAGLETNAARRAARVPAPEMDDVSHAMAWRGDEPYHHDSPPR